MPTEHTFAHRQYIGQSVHLPRRTAFILHILVRQLRPAQSPLNLQGQPELHQGLTARREVRYYSTPSPQTTAGDGYGPHTSGFLVSAHITVVVVYRSVPCSFDV